MNIFAAQATEIIPTLVKVFDEPLMITTKPGRGIGWTLTQALADPVQFELTKNTSAYELIHMFNEFNDRNIVINCSPDAFQEDELGDLSGVVHVLKAACERGEMFFYSSRESLKFDFTGRVFFLMPYETVHMSSLDARCLTVFVM